MDNLETFTKQKIAKHQIERAISLYLDEADFISAITLAGAAEEILGKLVKQTGGITAYEAVGEIIEAVNELTNKQQYSKNDLNELFNSTRNNLKHLSGSEQFVVDMKQEANNMLYRAISNYRSLTSKETELMKKWLATPNIEPAFMLNNA